MLRASRIEGNCGMEFIHVQVNATSTCELTPEGIETTAFAA